jgi:hypothetical protein
VSHWEEASGAMRTLNPLSPPCVRIPAVAGDRAPVAHADVLAESLREQEIVLWKIQIGCFLDRDVDDTCSVKFSHDALI